MKSMFEYLGTIILLSVISLIFVSIMSIGFQEISARNHHTRVVEDIQYKGNYQDCAKLNYGENIILELMKDGVIKVIYQYEISVPVFGAIKAKNIVGYAR